MNINCPACGNAGTKRNAREYFCQYCGTVFEPTGDSPAPTSPVAPTAPTAPQRPDVRSAEEIFAKNRFGVVEIETDAGFSSGFIVSTKGLVLTNAHAVIDKNKKPAKRIYVKICGITVKAHVIALGDTDINNAEGADLALLMIETIPDNAISVALDKANSPRIGQKVYYIGNSKGEGICMTAGIISDDSRKVGERYYIMTDAATNPGNSGGPLFNERGNVIGVHVSARNEAVGMKYAIPIERACMFLNCVEERLKLKPNVLADNIVTPPVENECLEIISMILAGITLIIDNIKYIKTIIDLFKK